MTLAIGLSQIVEHRSIGMVSYTPTTADAFHLALATWHGVDYLTSWNCRHIASARVREAVRRINDRRGLATPLICTPEELLEF